MSIPVRHGSPHTLKVVVDERGKCLRFKNWTEEVIFRSDGPCTVFWSKEDFEEDKNGQLIPGEEPAFEFRIEASVINVWVRGPGNEANLSITYTTRGF